MQTLPNGIEVPTNSDTYKLTEHLANMGTTTNTVIPVVSQTDRDSLHNQFPGGVLPVPTLVARTDLAGVPLEKWDGTNWYPLGEENIPWLGMGAWSSPDGIISRHRSGSKWIVRFIGHLVLSQDIPFTLTTAMAVIGTAVPSGWTPAPGIVYGTGAYSNNFATYQGPIVARVDTNGALAVATVTGSMSIVNNSQFFIDVSWTN